MTHEPLEETDAADIWSNWLLHLRHADDPALDRAAQPQLQGFADRVLDGARLGPGMSLADIGTGDGLVAFRALERIGPTLSVILTDVSAPLLRHAKNRASERNVAAQCRFVHCPADRLTGIEPASVDAAVTRSVLAYVADKAAALQEFRRILKPGGRISLGEPIFRDDALDTGALRHMVEHAARDPGTRFVQLLHRWKAAQFPDTPEKIAENPLTNFTERDLVRLAQAAGFTQVHLEFHIDIVSSIRPAWSAVLGSAPHPWAPTLGSILAERFSAEERQFFEPIVQAMIQSPQFGIVTRMAYLTAVKPADEGLAADAALNGLPPSVRPAAAADPID